VAAGALEHSGLIPRPDGIDHEGEACFPLTAAGTTMGVLGLPADLPGLSGARRLAIGAAAALLAVSLRSLRLLDEARQNSPRDSLTGCVNRGHALEVIAAELRRARRSRLPLSLIFFDVDRFNALNERYGYLCGDAVLSEIGARMRATLRRAGDLTCRYGGDEFLVLLPETPLDGARLVAEKLRRAIASMSTSWNGDPVQVTCSFGVAAAREDELDPKTLIARAGEAFETARRDGRDCVRLADDAAQQC
jgi:diguanylate cyclase